jgi:hypothetical protein
MSRRIAILLLVITLLVGVNGVAWWRAQPPQAAYDTLTDLIAREDVLSAIANANAAPARDLATTDIQWRREAAAANQGPLINETMATALSRQLALDRVQSDGHIIQIMVMDARGGLVAADKPTHDYDQSDEPKWQRTAGAKIMTPVFEGSEKTQHGTIDQISRAVAEPNHHIVGAVTLRWCRTSGGC